MKTSLQVLSLLATCTLLLAGCNESTSAQPQTQNPVGTGDSGGGNLYHGRPLESYIVKIEDLPAYKHRIAPIITSLLTYTSPPSDHFLNLDEITLGEILKYLIANKSWYFIDGELNTLPPDRISSAVPTQQGALQDYQQVWINASMFNAMNEEDQANLLMHEMLMGLRVLKFDSPKNQCLADHDSTFVCKYRSEKHLGTLDQITGPAYPDIREAVFQIMHFYPSFTANDWSNLLIKYNFNFDEAYGGVFHDPSENGLISTADVIKNIDHSALTNNLPTYGFSGFDFQNSSSWKSSESCKLTFNPASSGKSSSLTLLGGTFSTSVSLDFGKLITTSYDMREMNHKSLLHVASAYPYQLTKGEHSLFTDFYFDNGGYLAGVEITETVCTQTQASECVGLDTVKDGTHYFCYNQPEMDWE